MTRLAVLSLLSTLATLTGACVTTGSEGAGGSNTTEALTAGDGGQADAPNRWRGRRGPPPQAIEACAESEEGAACSFEGRRGNAEGTCTTCPRTEGLVCTPEGRGWGRGKAGRHGRHGRRGHRGPPPQAVEACAESAEGATCSFEGRRGAAEGTCATCPRTEGLVCTPEGRGWGRGHHGSRGRRGPPPAPDSGTL